MLSVKLLVTVAETPLPTRLFLSGTLIHLLGCILTGNVNKSRSLVEGAKVRFHGLRSEWELTKEAVNTLLFQEIKIKLQFEVKARLWNGIFKLYFNFF